MKLQKKTRFIAFNKKLQKHLLNNQANVAEMAAHARQLIASRYEHKMVWEAILKEYQSL